jgi:hypothetical protein
MHSNDGITLQVRVNGQTGAVVQNVRAGGVQGRNVSNYSNDRTLHNTADEENAEGIGGPFDKHNIEAPAGSFKKIF